MAVSFNLLQVIILFFAGFATGYIFRYYKEKVEGKEEREEEKKEEEVTSS